MSKNSIHRKALFSMVLAFILLFIFAGGRLTSPASAGTADPIQMAPSLSVTHQSTVEPQTVNPPNEPIPAQVIIRFTPNTSEVERAAYIESLGGTIVKDIEALDTVVVTVPELVAKELLPESPAVAETEPDYYVSALDDFIPVVDNQSLDLPNFQLPYDKNLRVAWTGGPHAYNLGGEFTLKYPTGEGSGLDFSNGTNFNVLAMAAGDVIKADCNAKDVRGLGCQVAIQHFTGGSVMVYSHLQANSIEVKVGDKVVAGTILGKAGNTGLQDNVHLHIEFRNGQKDKEGNWVCWRQCLSDNLGGNPFAWDDGIPFVDGYRIFSYIADGEGMESYNYDGSAVRGTVKVLDNFHYSDSGRPVTPFAARVGINFSCLYPNNTNVQFSCELPQNHNNVDGATKFASTDTAYTFSLEASDVSDEINALSINDVNYLVSTNSQIISPTDPTPTATSPVSQNGIEIVSTSSHTVQPGEKFNPSVTIRVASGYLDPARGDHLHAVSENQSNTMSAWPVQAVKSYVSTGQTYTFNVGNDSGFQMTAPNTPGVYQSVWQMRVGGNHIGPQVVININVQGPNRAPSSPTANTPGDWSEIRSVQAPELCWSAVSDPDGDPVQYYAEIYQSAVLDNSGWISGTCWRPTNISGKYFGYQWHVKARDNRGGESGYGNTNHFTLSPPPYDPQQPTSTPPAVSTLPIQTGYSWNSSYLYRRPLTITTNSDLKAGMLIKVDGMDLEALVAEGKMRSDHNDLRIVRRLSATTWQEVPRNYYSGWDVEFPLLSDIYPGTDTSYYLYYGNPSAGAPPTFTMANGWYVDMYSDKWWSSWGGTWNYNQTMDFNDVCGSPLNHSSKLNSSFDDSDKFRGRLYVPTTGTWTFKVYTNDGYRLYLDDVQVGVFDGYNGNRWATIGSIYLKAGWHKMDARNMWVNCGAWKLSMSGPGFGEQIIPSNYFQKSWGNVKTGVNPSAEESTAPAANAPTLNLPTNNATVGRYDMVILSWNAASGATQYYVEFWDDSGLSVNSGWTSNLSYTVGSTFGGGTYQWRVKSKNSSNVESGWSETRTLIRTYGSPSSLTATATGSQVNLSWSASADAPGNIQGYRIYRNGTAIATVGSSTTSYSDTDISCNTSYSYTVRAYKGTLESNTSNTANATPINCPPAAPSNLEVRGATSSSITLAWQDNSNNESGFRIYRWGYGDNGWAFYYLAAVGANVTTYTQTGLSCGNDFNFYEITSYNNHGESARVGWVQGITSPCPDLAPNPRPGRADPVIVSSVPGTATNNTLYAGQPVYFDWGFTNLGNADVNGNYYVDLYIDDQRLVHYPFNHLGVRANNGFDDWLETWNQPGWHTVTLMVDPDNTVEESNEENNIWTKDFYWVSAAPSNPIVDTFRSTAAQDGWILESSETSNKGGKLNKGATTLQLGDDAARKQYLSILSFDTSSIPDNAVITKVTLRVKQQGVTGGGNPVNMFQGFMADIKRGSFGAPALVAGDFQAKAQKTVGPIKKNPNGSGWYVLNLTPGKNFVNKLASGNGLTQIRLRFKLDDNDNGKANFLKLFSGNAADANRPQLIIEYYVP